MAAHQSLPQLCHSQDILLNFWQICLFFASIIIANLGCCYNGLPQLFATKIPIVLNNTPAYGTLLRSTLNQWSPNSSDGAGCQNLSHADHWWSWWGMAKPPQTSTVLNWSSVVFLEWTLFNLLHVFGQLSESDMVVLTCLCSFIIFFWERLCQASHSTVPASPPFPFYVIPLF